MLVMLAYDLPTQKLQNLIRKEFERLGGYRVQYSLYLFKGEPHEVDRVIRHMRRVAQGLRETFVSSPWKKAPGRVIS